MTATAPHIERIIPAQPWAPMAIIAALLVVAAGAWWETHCRALGYPACINDTRDLWVDNRRRVEPDSTVIIGASRGLFGLDLDELEKGLGKRPIQLCLVGSCIYPVLKHFADDASFHGTVICDLVPGLLLVPPFAPPYQNAQHAIERLHSQTWSQRWSFLLSLPLERTFACLKQEDLTLGDLLRDLPIANREHALIGPPLPPFFATLDRERRMRMIERMDTDEKLRDRVKFGWIPLFSPPPKPHWIPDEAFAGFIHGMVEGRFAEMAKAVAAIHARGGRVVFVRMPSMGGLHTVEDHFAPRATVWDRVLKDTGAPGVFAEDHPELASFILPEWSHLRAADSVVFTRRLAPYLKAALAGTDAAHP
jgi:hypothetical protein